MLHIRVIEYMLVSNITVTNKYICTLIYNCTITQHTHVIFSQNVISGIINILYTEKHITWNNIQCYSHHVYKKYTRYNYDITCNITLTSMSS